MVLLRFSNKKQIKFSNLKFFSLLELEDAVNKLALSRIIFGRNSIPSLKSI